MKDHALYLKACEALKNAYVPYSGFSVGAALLCEDGALYTGCNVESASFGATCCAERTAMVKAISEGQRKFDKIAVASSSGEKTFPCGICRQFLMEFEPALTVIVGDGQNTYPYPLQDLLPEAFTGKEIQ